MDNKGNNFFSIVKAIIIILFIAGCTIGGVFAGQKLAEKNFKRTDSSIEIKTEDDKIDTKEEIDNCVSSVKEDFKYNNGHYYAVSYSTNEVFIVGSEMYVENYNSDRVAPLDGVVTGVLKPNKSIVKVGVYNGIANDASEGVFIIYEDGSVSELVLLPDGNINESKNIFDGYKIKDISKFDAYLGDEGFKITVYVTLQDGTETTIVK